MMNEGEAVMVRRTDGGPAMDICPECKGSGFANREDAAGNRVTCPTCKGLGDVPVPAR